MSQSHPFHHLISVLQDGVSFYTEAAKVAHLPAYRSVFERMARGKQALIAALERVDPSEKSHDHGTLAGSLRQAYADLRAKLSDRPDDQYIIQLEAAEDRILHAFEDASKDDTSTLARSIASQHLPEIRRMHDEMRALKQQVKQAAWGPVTAWHGSSDRLGTGPRTWYTGPVLLGRILSCPPPLLPFSLCWPPRWRIPRLAGTSTPSSRRQSKQEASEGADWRPTMCGDG